jgi:hypothetical protein
MMMLIRFRIAHSSLSKACLLYWLFFFTGAGLAAQFQGTATSFGREQCFILNHFPEGSGAVYHQSDAKKEKELCGVSFDDKGIGLCPKTWSTSPGTIVYDMRESKYNGNPEAFGSAFCARQRALKDTAAGVDKLASFKQSVNGQFHQSTSATYAQASGLYYHFSRYLNAIVDVPVAVMRTMDRQAHLHRVASKGPAIAQGRMIAAGWNVVNSAEKNPAGYAPTNEFYYGDPQDGLLYGVMLKNRGERYGAEFNGNISGKGYTEQYAFMQKTPAFIALASQANVLDALPIAVAQSKKDPVVGKALGATLTNEQMMFWMRELSEILILDHIFSQQDRPGNIDYTWDWYYVDEAGELKSVRTDSKVSRSGTNSIQPPDEVKQIGRRYLIQKTQLNDNDAGGRRYTNFTQKFGLLAKLRHLNPVSYRQLVRLAKDFETKGPFYKYLQDTFYISDANADLISRNAIQAAQILHSACIAGTMKFDLNPEVYLVKQQVEQVQVDCENP